MEKTRGLVFNIQPFSLHDGPGTRTTVFRKGCNLRCWWCHNPESWRMEPELLFYGSRCIGCGACAQACPGAVQGKSVRFTEQCAGCGLCAEACYAGALQLTGEWTDADALADRLLEDADIFRHSGGGVTFSGGEPLLQPDFLEQVINRLRSEKIHIALETALNVPADTLSRIAPKVDLIYADIKSADSEKHRKATGVGNERILENIRVLSESGKEMCLRTPVIPGFNDDEESIGAIAGFIRSLPVRHRAELLAFHGLCSGKYEALNRPFEAYALREPDRQRMEKLTAVLTGEGIDAIYRM